MIDADETTTCEELTKLTEDVASNGDTGKVDLSKVIISQKRRLVYRVTDIPKFHTSCLYGFQIAMQKVEPCVTIAIIISNLICGSEEITTKLISTAAMMTGLCTFLQNSIGVRLPMFQGPGISMIVPLVNFAGSGECGYLKDGMFTNATLNETSEFIQKDQQAMGMIQMTMGALMASSFIHMMLGLTGITGKISPYFGPLTISPALFVILIHITYIGLGFCRIHPGVAVFTGVLVLTLTSYVGHVTIPVPTWNRKEGFHTERYPLMRTLAVIIAIGLGWLLCHILTITNMITEDPEDLYYQARTDRPNENLKLTSWFYVPYPGQFGPPSFHVGLFAGFCISMITSVVDSMADYIFASRVCQVPSPPPHAINRGIMVEGFSSILSGAFGACHATVTYTGSIGNLALTGVASRRVFQMAGIILVIFAMIGKLGAVFASIPKPVLGGYLLVSLSSAVGVALSAVNEVDMTLPRNVSALGVAIGIGFMVPEWVNHNKLKMATGIAELDQVILSLMGNPMFLAGAVGCFLDNTLPGQSAKPEQSAEDDQDGDNEDDREDVDTVYNLPFFNNFFSRWRWTKYLPFLPSYNKRD